MTRPEEPTNFPEIPWLSTPTLDDLAKVEEYYYKNSGTKKSLVTSVALTIMKDKLIIGEKMGHPGGLRLATVLSYYTEPAFLIMEAENYIGTGEDFSGGAAIDLTPEQTLLREANLILISEILKKETPPKAYDFAVKLIIQQDLPKIEQEVGEATGKLVKESLEHSNQRFHELYNASIYLLSEER